MYFSSKHRSHKLARLKVDDEVGHVKSGDLTRIRGQNGPDDDYLAAAAWHSTVYGATKREKSPSTQLNLSLVEKKLGLRFQTSLYFKLKLLSRTMSLLSYTSDRPKIRFGQTFWQCLVSSVSDKEWKNFASSVVPIFAIFWKKCTDFSMNTYMNFLHPKMRVCTLFPSQIQLPNTSEQRPINQVYMHATKPYHH